MQKIVVNKKYDGKQLSQLLLDNFSGLTMNTFYKALRKKDIRINNVRTNKNDVVHLGDEIQIFVIDELLYKSFVPDIIYEDDNIVVVNKPAEIEVVGENSLTSELCKYYNIAFIFPFHRLDRNTTGLVLFAKNEEALNILLDKFKNREIEKHYKALVYGIPRKKEDTLTAYLFKDAKKSLVYISDVPKKGYEKIITSYKVISCNNKNNTSLLDVNLHTGKTHQIRAHLAHIGYPIIGDGKYGDREINKKFGYKYQQLCSRSLRFCFKTDAGILNYLNNKNVSI